jgi:hypothetical protein
VIKAAKPSSDWRRNASTESLERERRRALEDAERIKREGVCPEWWGDGGVFES